MKLSVVIATYNGSAYLSEQLESIIGQTVKPDEIVLFDDCSTDETLRMVKDFAKTHDEYDWVIHFNPQNMGFRKNFHEALKASTGDLIFLCDQDDIWFPDKIAKMRDVMTGNSDIQLLGHTYSNMYPDGRKERQSIDDLIPGDKVCIDKEKALYQVVKRKNIVLVHLPGCSYCVRRSFFDLCDRYWIDRNKYDKERELMWREAELNELYRIRQFAADENISDAYRKCVERNISYVETRKKFLQTKNPFYGIGLLKYLDLYIRRRGWVKDWFVAYAPAK